MTSLFEGTFTSVKDDAFVDYCIKTGLPKDEAKKMKGTHWKMAISKNEDIWVGHITCQEVPSLNSLETFKEGQETSIDSPLWGGKGKVSFKQTGDTTFLTTINSEKYGVTEIKEKYCDEGATYHTTHKNSGATLEEFWPREVKETGWFRMESSENLSKFMQATGFPSNMTDYRFCLCKCGDNYRITEITDGQSNTYSFKIDEEFDFSFPGLPSADRRLLFTKMGNGKYKMFSKGKSGQKEEWELKFCPLGAMWTGVDKVSGQSTKIRCKPFVNMCGEYKLLAQNGAEEFTMALGVPADVATKLANDFDAKMIISEKGGVYRTIYDSKIFPMDITCKMDEEYTVTYPGDAGTYKCLDSLHGNVLINVSKGPKFTTKTRAVITDNYFISESWIVGTNISEKLIMERVA